MEHIKNIEKVFAQADDVDIREGKIAYQNYHALLKNISQHYNIGFVQTVAAFVSLSPSNNYQGNLKSLVSLLDGVNKGFPVEQIITTTFKHCLVRAYDYVSGDKDFLLETKGLKIKNFYCSILKPYDKQYITIDGHMHNVWNGKQLTMRQALVPPKKYDLIANDFRRVAAKHKLIPNQLQAICWFTWKRINNIKYQSQCSIFGDTSDYWGLKIKPESIIPFK